MSRRFSALIAALVLILCWACALGEAPAATDNEPQYAPLQPGDSGQPVMLLQCRLIELGYYRDIAEGTYGPVTQDAVMDFQAVNGFEADGIASQEVLEALYGEGAVDADGEAREAFVVPAFAEADASEKDSPVVYIGNRNTHKFHAPECESVMDIKDSNRMPLYSRDEALVRGFVPCKRCNP